MVLATFDAAREIVVLQRLQQVETFVAKTRRRRLAAAGDLLAGRPCPCVFAAAQTAGPFLRLHFRCLRPALLAQPMGRHRIVRLLLAHRLQLGVTIPHPCSITTFRGTWKCLILKGLEYRIAFLAHHFRTWILAACQLLYHFFLRDANRVSASADTTFNFRLRKKVT